MTWRWKKQLLGMDLILTDHTGSLNRVPALADVKAGISTSDGCQVTLCDRIWHVRFRSGDAGCKNPVSCELTLFTHTLWSRLFGGQRLGQMKSGLSCCSHLQMSLAGWDEMLSSWNTTVSPDTCFAWSMAGWRRLLQIINNFLWKYLERVTFLSLLTVEKCSSLTCPVLF